MYEPNGIHSMTDRKDINIYEVDATTEAQKLGNDKAFNMIILGGVLQIAPMVKLESVIAGLKKSLPERHHKLIPMNEEAIKVGMGAIRKINDAVL